VSTAQSLVWSARTVARDLADLVAVAALPVALVAVVIPWPA